MSLNILYHHRTQGRGAEGHHIASIVREMRAMGHRVTVLSPHGIDPLDEGRSAPVDKTQVATGGIQSVWKWISRRAPNFVFELAEIAYNISAYRRLNAALAAERFDLVYERYAFYLVAGAALAARRGIPFVLEANEVSGIAGRARRQAFPRLCRAFEGFLLRRCTAILAVSSHLRERILRRGIAASSVHVVPNAFSTERLPEHRDNRELAATLGLEGSTVLGFAGWFDTWDRLDWLIGNFAILRRDHPGLKLLLIGDGAVMPELRREAKRLAVEADVVFTGAVPRTEIYRYLSLLDIAVLAHSNDFGSPVVMFEFMGLKIPLVAPRLAPILDVHRHDGTALLFAPLDGADCRHQLERLIRSKPLRASIAAQAYAKLVADHTWRGNAELIVAAAGLSAAGSASAGSASAGSASPGSAGRAPQGHPSAESPSLCVVGELPPPTGGMAVQAQQLTEGLRREGHRVIQVRTNPLPQGSSLRRIPVLRAMANAVWFAWNLVRAVPKVDCIHVLSNSGLGFFLFTVPAVLLGRMFGKRIIVHYHGGGAKAFLARWKRLALPVLSRADVLIVPSAFLSDVFRHHGLVPLELPNVMDLEAFPFHRREPLEPVVLIARHLKPEYNVASAIRAFAEIAGQHPNATAVIAGDGADREALERLCEELGVAARVRFVGNVDSRQMQALYAQSHIYLNASRVDNQPVSILEAFAAGLPVVSTAAGGIPFLVEDGQSGLLTSDDSHQSLAAHLRTLLARPDIVRHLVDNARASVQFHRWDAVYPRLAELYRSPDLR